MPMHHRYFLFQIFSRLFYHFLASLTTASSQEPILFDRFAKSLRVHFISFNPEYSKPLLRHFTNYLVSVYEFHYKNEQCLKENVLYKTLKHPSKFEVLTGTPDVGVVIYEATK